MMRHGITVASVVAMLLASTPVLARTMTHQSGGVVAHHHAVVGNRFVIVSRGVSSDRVLLFDHFSRRFLSVPRHRFDHLDGVDGFGGWGWWGSDGWADGTFVASAEPPPAAADAPTRGDARTLLHCRHAVAWSSARPQCCWELPAGVSVPAADGVAVALSPSSNGTRSAKYALTLVRNLFSI
jgi:hypothetical protein